MVINMLKKNVNFLINKDEKLAELVASMVKCFFKIKDSEMITKNIEDKNWKMSELVDNALASNSIKVIIK